MTSIGRPIAAQALAALFSIALIGCGGSSNDAGADSPPVTAPGGPAPSAYLRWGMASSDVSRWKWLVVIDPAQPSAPKHSILMTNAEGKPAAALPVAATAIEPASGKVTALGHSRLFYLDRGQVYGLDLSIARGAAPQRLSDLTDACELVAVYPLVASGDEAWAMVKTAGADGSCGTSADNNYVMVRSTMNASSAARPSPVTRPEDLWPLPDEAGRVLGFVASGPPYLRRFDTDLSAYSLVSGGNLAGTLVGGFPSARKLYVRAGGGLRALTYTDSSSSVGPILISIPSLTSFEAGYGKPFFAFGHELYKLTPEGPIHLATFESEVWEITPTDNFVVVLLGGTLANGYRDSLWSVSQSGGAPIDLKLPSIGATPPYVGRINAVAGDRYHYFVHYGNGVGQVEAIDADGRNAGAVAVAVRYVGQLWQPQLSANHYPNTAAILVCSPLSGRTDCDGAPLVQMDVGTGKPTTLGTLPSTGSATRTWYMHKAEGLAGQPFLATGIFEDRKDGGYRQIVDLFLATPGINDSLRAVTSNLSAP